jgi:hypothetical protein
MSTEWTRQPVGEGYQLQIHTRLPLDLEALNFYRDRPRLILAATLSDRCPVLNPQTVYSPKLLLVVRHEDGVLRLGLCREEQIHAPDRRCP